MAPQAVKYKRGSEGGVSVARSSVFSIDGSVDWVEEGERGGADWEPGVPRLLTKITLQRGRKAAGEPLTSRI